MSAKKQSGKGISGFMLGLLLATAVIAGILFFLNKSNQETFKEEKPKELPKPEILTPKSSKPDASAPSAASEAVPASDVFGGFVERQTQQSASAAETGSAVSEPEAPDTSVVTVPPKTVPAKPKTEAGSADKKPEVKPEVKKAQPKKEESKKEEPKKSQPTPEQILNSGSIEKAREEARAEAEKKETAKAKAQKTESGKAESSKKSAEEGGRTVLQMGSFNNRESAEAQRAKLAMMGVSSSVTEGEVNGKPVYRVQSGRMSSEAARNTQQTLKRNGVDSFTRTVK